MSVQHPEWLAVGSAVEIVRRLGRSVAWRKKVAVVRHTATSVVVSHDLGSEERFVAKGNRYVLTPKYIDYETHLEPMPPSEAEIAATDD